MQPYAVYHPLDVVRECGGRDIEGAVVHPEAYHHEVEARKVCLAALDELHAVVGCLAAHAHVDEFYHVRVTAVEARGKFVFYQIEKRGELGLEPHHGRGAHPHKDAVAKHQDADGLARLELGGEAREILGSVCLRLEAESLLGVVECVCDGEVPCAGETAFAHHMTAAVQTAAVAVCRKSGADAVRELLRDAPAVQPKVAEIGHPAVRIDADLPPFHRVVVRVVFNAERVVAHADHSRRFVGKIAVRRVAEGVQDGGHHLVVHHGLVPIGIHPERSHRLRRAVDVSELLRRLLVVARKKRRRSTAHHRRRKHANSRLFQPFHILPLVMPKRDDAPPEHPFRSPQPHSAGDDAPPFKPLFASATAASHRPSPTPSSNTSIISHPRPVVNPACAGITHACRFGE